MSLADLEILRDQVKSKVDLREKGDHVDKMAVIRIAMATCGIAAGAREVMVTLVEAVSERGLSNVVITQGCCMGYCYAEPIAEVTLPGKEPVVYGHVSKERAIEILEKHVLGGELLDGIIPTNYQSIDE